MMTTFWRHWLQLIFSAWNHYHTRHITDKFYRRMMHEKDEWPPNEKSHAYHFSITYNGSDFCLVTPSAILALPKCLLKGWRLKFRGFICLRRSCSSHCNWNWSALHKDEHKKDAKHKKLLNLLCIVYLQVYSWKFCLSKPFMLSPGFASYFFGSFLVWQSSHWRESWFYQLPFILTAVLHVAW